MGTHDLQILSARLFRSIANGAVSATVHVNGQGIEVGDVLIYREQIAMYPQIGLHDVRQRFLPSGHWAKVTVTSVLPAQEIYPELKDYSLIGFRFEEEGVKRGH